MAGTRDTSGREGALEGGDVVVDLVGGDAGVPQAEEVDGAGGDLAAVGADAPAGGEGDGDGAGGVEAGEALDVQALQALADGGEEGADAGAAVVAAGPGDAGRVAVPEEGDVLRRGGRQGRGVAAADGGVSGVEGVRHQRPVLSGSGARTSGRRWSRGR